MLEWIGWVTVLVTLLSPFFAVQASLKLGQKKEQRDRKFAVFRTLMLTRGTMLATEHVRALNEIEMEFHADPKARAILAAWRAYKDHLRLPKVQSEAEAAVWTSTRLERMVALLHSMAIYFKYDFDEAFIRNPTYQPDFYGKIEDQELQARALMLEVLKGDRLIGVGTIALPASSTTLALPKPTPTPQANETDQLKKQLDEPTK
jgi:hypothetical protein